MERQTLRFKRKQRRTELGFCSGGKVDSSPTVADGVVYVGSHNGKLYALNASTGMVGYDWELHNNVIWSFQAKDMFMFSAPAISGGVVYVGSYDGNIYAINASTGQQKWSFQTGYAVVSSPAVSDGIVYVGSEDNHLYALNAETGAQVWNHTFSDMIITSSPAVVNGCRLCWFNGQQSLRF